MEEEIVRRFLSHGISRREFVRSLTALGVSVVAARSLLAQMETNTPLGQGKGIHPGRVVWVRDPAATSWDGTTGHWWDDSNSNQAVIDRMMSRSLQGLTGQKSDRQAWDGLFRHFNQTHGLGNVGYRPGEKIAIKLNCNQDRSPVWGGPRAAPQMPGMGGLGQGGRQGAGGAPGGGPGGMAPDGFAGMPPGGGPPREGMPPAGGPPQGMPGGVRLGKACRLAAVRRRGCGRVWGSAERAAKSALGARAGHPTDQRRRSRRRHHVLRGGHGPDDRRADRHEDQGEFGGGVPGGQLPCEQRLRACRADSPDARYGQPDSLREFGSHALLPAAAGHGGEVLDQHAAAAGARHRRLHLVSEEPLRIDLFPGQRRVDARRRCTTTCRAGARWAATARSSTCPATATSAARPCCSSSTACTRLTSNEGSVIRFSTFGDRWAVEHPDVAGPDCHRLGRARHPEE